MSTPEGIVEKYFLKRSTALGFMCLKFTAPGTAGVPDRIIIRDGRTVFVELKAPGEGPRRLQREVIKDLRSHGALVYLADTKELVDELLTELAAGRTPDPAKAGSSPAQGRSRPRASRRVPRAVGVIPPNLHPARN
jgi:hypothetical protein